MSDKCENADRYHGPCPKCQYTLPRESQSSLAEAKGSAAEEYLKTHKSAKWCPICGFIYLMRVAPVLTTTGLILAALIGGWIGRRSASQGPVNYWSDLSPRNSYTLESDSTNLHGDLNTLNLFEGNHIDYVPPLERDGRWR